jgi:hypothetical protein
MEAEDAMCGGRLVDGWMDAGHGCGGGWMKGCLGRDDGEGWRYGCGEDRNCRGGFGGKLRENGRPTCRPEDGASWGHAGEEDRGGGNCGMWALEGHVVERKGFGRIWALEG